jgi:hypothetical protein
VSLLQATELIKYLTGWPLPAKVDPLHQVRGWKDIARMIQHERQTLLTEGKPVFLITDHYGTAGILSFYLPEARTNVAGQPLVYCVRSLRPQNQFYFWAGYQDRKGQDAIYIRENDTPVTPPATLSNDFRSVSFLGAREAYYDGRPFRRYQLFLCHDLR